MAETNFVDYVRIYCRSGKGGEGLHISAEKSMYPKGAPMEVMEVMEEVLYLEAIATIGLYSTYVTNVIS